MLVENEKAWLGDAHEGQIDCLYAGCTTLLSFILRTRRN